VEDALGGYQEEGDDSERDLEELRSTLAGSGRLGAPLRRRAGAQGANAPEDVEVDEGAEGGGDHHGDSDGVAVEAGGRRVEAEGCRGQGAETDGNANSAEGDDGGAGALENNEDEAGGGDEPGLSALWSGRGGWCRGHSDRRARL
jgi:hypothetical protein